MAVPDARSSERVNQREQARPPVDEEGDRTNAVHTSDPDPRRIDDHPDTQDATTAEQPDAEVSTPDVRGCRLGPLIAAIGVVVLLLAATVTSGVVWNGARAAAADRENVLSAARQAAVNLTTIDFNSVESDVRRVLDGATGDFGGLFGQNVDSYVGVVKEGQVVTKGEIAEAGVQELDDSSATVLVAITTTVKNKNVPNGEQRSYRLVERMEKHSGSWLVSRVDFVP